MKTKTAMPTDSAEPIISVRGLGKSFGKVTALDGVDFDVPQGRIFGFLGPNGAGKTTTINILTGLMRPERGSVSIAGIDCAENAKAAQHLMGVVADQSNLYPELTGFENLCFCAALYGLSKKTRQDKARHLLNIFGLTDAADRKFSGYSKGMKRKLTIASAIIHQPKILFLDEPTTGIDVASARQIRQLILDLNRQGTTVFLTTHYIEEAQRLCERIAFIVNGKIAHIDRTENLLRSVHGRHIIELTLNSSTEDISDKLNDRFDELEVESLSRSRFRFTADKPVNIGPLIQFFESQGLEVGEARKARPTLEQVFVEITGIEAELMTREKEKAETQR